LHEALKDIVRLKVDKKITDPDVPSRISTPPYLHIGVSTVRKEQRTKKGGKKKKRKGKKRNNKSASSPWVSGPTREIDIIKSQG
jgi:hypothetical protein